MIKVAVKGAMLVNLQGGGKGGLELTVREGTTVQGLLEEISKEFGEDFRNIIYRDGEKELRKGLRLLVNDRDITGLNGLDTVLQNGDCLSVRFVLAGG
jgi:molybdopterin converting factor small subunit